MREMNRDVIRQRASEYHIPLESTPILQRASSRQASIVASDYMDQGDVESTGLSLLRK